MTAQGECRFCAIVSGTAEASLVLQDQAAWAFLDVRPVFKGHVLVVPPTHVETLHELPDDANGAFFAAVKRVARAVERALGADGTFIAINNRVSQSVPHLHVHVVPRRRKDGLRGFFWPRQAYDSAEERNDLAARIRAAIE